ncbi:MAG: hypothetical protein U1C55_07640 [Smithellaceae bacterium]|nr:hypothetical protein [Smithellaceae bacterium]
MGQIKYLMALFVWVLLSLLMWPAVEASANNCSACHGDKTIIGKGAHLYIDPVKFDSTAHAGLGCVSCHDKVTKRHPADGGRPPRVSCKECHADIFAEHGKSGHGNYAGCTDCHNPHAVRPLAALSARDLNVQCAKCHEHSKIVLSHSKWLPHTALHIDALPCISCHTGAKNYVILLNMATNTSRSPRNGIRPTTFGDLRPFLAEGKKVSTLIDSNGDGAISLEELKKFNKTDQSRTIKLLGTMMPEVVTHTYETLDNRWDCTFCHASGPNAQQASFLAFPEPDGTYSRLPVEKGAIMDILYGTPDFYMIGFTRNTTMSILGGLIVAAGLLVPILHGTLRFLTRKRRKEG